jgi:hypothetical protein
MYRTVKLVGSPVNFGNTIANSTYINGVLNISLRSTIHPAAKSLFTAHNKLSEYVGYFDGTDPLYTNAGCLPSAYVPSYTLTTIASQTTIGLYNGGNADTYPTITVINKSDADAIDLIKLEQLDSTGTFIRECHIKDLPLSTTLTIDCEKALVLNGTSNGFAYHDKDFIILTPSNEYLMLEGIHVTNGSANIHIEAGTAFDTSVVGRYICFGGNKQYKISSLASSDTVAVLDAVATESTDTDYTAYIYDVNLIRITSSDYTNTSIAISYPYRYL